jgi:hypothetical protein
MGQLAELTHVVRELCLVEGRRTTALCYAITVGAHSSRACYAIRGRLVGYERRALSTHHGSEVRSRWLWP